MNNMGCEVDKALERITREGMVRDPVDEVALDALDELGDVLLNEYPFIRYVYEVKGKEKVTSHVLIGTLAGYTESGKKVMSDGTIAEMVFKKRRDAKLLVDKRDGWSLRMYVVPFSPNMRIRFWIHVEEPGFYGDLQGSRKFLVSDDKEVREVTKEEYERRR